MKIPPRLAMWLLHRLMIRNDGDAIIGDLQEQYHHGRSAAWFWRQVLIAIVVDASRDMRVHGLLAIRAVVTGFVAFTLLAWLLTRVAVNSLAMYVPVSWLLPHSGYPRGIEIVAALLMCVATFSSGWLVARFHRAHLAGTVLVYFASFVLYGLIVVVFVPQRLQNAHSYAYNFTSWLLVMALYSMSILLGGIWAIPGEDKFSRRARSVGA
jgi:hypothetical protein